jgi:TolB-like protein/DNA-binding winged helix-turn-helix (wHTH) protein
MSATPAPGGRSYEFGPYRLEPDSGCLFRKGHVVALPPKAFDTLSLLVQNAGRLVKKADLMAEIWPDASVEESNLTQQVFTIRRVLGEQPDGRPYIETIARRGYRFIAEVREPQPATPPELPSLETTARSERRSFRPAAALAVTLAALIAYGVIAGPNTPDKPAPDRSLIVVLPFDNAGNPDDDYLSDGLSDELIRQLSQLNPERLGVIARTTAVKYKHGGKTAAEVGSDLRAQYVLEGSVRRAGDRLNISARLLQTSDRTEIWSEEYDREPGDVFAVQQQVIAAVARHINVAPRGRRSGAQQVDSEAYELYLKGRYAWNQRRTEGLLVASQYFQWALDRDPGFALAYAGLGDIYSSSPVGRESYEKSETAAQKALQLDPSLGEAQVTLAHAVMHQLDWPRAHRYFERAIVLAPGYPPGRYWYAEYLVARGDFDRAISEAKAAEQLDPQSAIAVHGVGIMYYYARRFDEAIAQFERALALDPNHFWSRRRLANAYLMMGRSAEGVRIFEGHAALRQPAWLAYAYAAAGLRHKSEALFRSLRRGESPPYELATVAGALGLADQAFDWLDAAFQAGNYDLVYLAVDPRLDPLRDDPRFEQVLRRAGLEEHVPLPTRLP